MTFVLMKTSIVALVCGAVLGVGATPASAQEVSAEYQGVMKTIGKGGDYKEGVLKVNVPRNDLRVSIGGRSAPTPFGFGGWIALTNGDGGREVMMGDLVLTEEDVNPVIPSSGSNRASSTCTFTAWEAPRIWPSASGQRSI